MNKIFQFFANFSFHILSVSEKVKLLIEFIVDHYVLQGSTQPILSDVAYAVAHKLKSAIMSAARWALILWKR